MEKTGSRIDDESFHQMMERMYAEQGPLQDKSHGNDYYVASKLPGPLFARFYALCRAKKWNRATGVKYAILHLLNEIK